MSILQHEDLVTYQLRASYLTEIADGVGERLITLNDSFLNSAPFKAAGWRPNPALMKRCYSPPIPTAVPSEYFRAPRPNGMTLEDEPEEGGLLSAGGADTHGPSRGGDGMGGGGVAAASKRRRRREQMEEEDSSDLSDESDDDAEQRAAQQIKFAKMPLRNRAGSSPLLASKEEVAAAAAKRPNPRRGSQSAVEAVKERARRDTVTSSDMSSENESFETSKMHRQREAALDAAKKAVKLAVEMSDSEPPAQGITRVQSDLLPEEEEDDSEASDVSSTFNSAASASILAAVVENPMQNVSPTQPIVGAPPQDFRRQSTVRKSVNPVTPTLKGRLPPPRPMSMIRPASIIQPKSLLSAALNAKKAKPAIPFERFATLSGQGEAHPIVIRIYADFAEQPLKPFEVLIKRRVREEGAEERPINVADLIGLSLWRYMEENISPPLPKDKIYLNWYTLKMVEEGGEVDDDFPPLERNKPLASFVTAACNKTEGARQQVAAPRRGRANTKTSDDFALVLATDEEYEGNKAQTPQYSQERSASSSSARDDEDTTPRNTPQPSLSFLGTDARTNTMTTTYRPDGLLADMPRPMITSSNAQRGQQKFLRIHLHLPDSPPDQMVTLDVTTDMYIEEVLDLVCKKRNLDKAMHILRIPSSKAVALLDRPVSAIGAVSDLELHKRRFGEAAMGGSPGSSASQRAGGAFGESYEAGKKSRKKHLNQQQQLGSSTGGGMHPLAKEALAQDELIATGGASNSTSNSNRRTFVVWRKQPMRFVGMNERLFVVDGEYIHIIPSTSGKPATDSSSKTTTVHFSHVVGCKLSRRHPSNFKLVVFRRDAESKTYEFEAKNQQEAAEAVFAIKSGTAPHQ